MRPLSSSLHKIAKRTTHMALIMSALCIGSGSISPHKALAQDITSDLAAHWALDETSGATIKDTSGNNNNGTWDDNDDNDVTGETTTGVYSNALDFNGAGDHIDAVEITANKQTISAWVYPHTTNTNSIFSKGVDVDNGHISLILHSGNRLYARATRSNGSIFNCYGTTTVPTNTWSMVTATFDTTTSTIKTYINGTHVTTCTSSLFTTNTKIWYLGYHPQGSYTYYFNGLIDDVLIYNRILSDDDIAALYLGSPTQYQCSAPGGIEGELRYNGDSRVLQYCDGTTWQATGIETEDVTENLISRWRLNETSGTTATDSVSGHNGTLSGSMDAASDTEAGVDSTALSFNGSNDYILLPTTTDFNIPSGGGFTASAWVKTTDSYGPIIALRSTLSSDAIAGLYIGYNGVNNNAGHVSPLMRYNSNSGRKEFGATAAINDGNWHHVAMVIDQDNDLFITYIDGTPYNIAQTINGALDFQDHISIGAELEWITANDSGANTDKRFLEGTIDDVRIYQRALTASEISTLYSIAPGCSEITTDNLVAQWKLDETTGTTATDSVGSNDGTYNGFDATSTVAGIDGTAQNFDGTDDYIEIPDSADFTFTGDFALSAWIKHSGAAEANVDDGWRIISQQESGNHFVFRINDSSGGTNGTVHFSIYNGSHNYVNSTTNVKDGQWHHLVAVREGSDIHIYVDGVLDNTANSVFTSTIDITANNVLIGNKRAASSNRENFSGAIDDVRVYHKALTGDEISDMYNIMSGNCVAGSRACTSPLGVEGSMIFNTDDNVMQYCNGADWIALGPANDGGVACTNPAGLPGEMLYEQNYRTPIYCEGDEWIAFGKDQNTLPLDGLVAWYNMNETSGTNIADTSGNANDASLVDPVSGVIDIESTTGVSKYAMTFASGVNDYIQMPNSADFNIPSNGGLSISAWVKTTDSFGPIVALRSNLSSDAIAGLYVGYNGVYSTAGHIVPLMRYNGNSGRKEFSTTAAVNDGNWHHVAMVVDQANNLFITYIDGVAYNITQNTNGAFNFQDLLAIGAELEWITANDSGANNDRRFLDGAIDNVMIYNRVLTSAEITTIYNAHAP